MKESPLAEIEIKGHNWSKLCLSGKQPASLFSRLDIIAQSATDF